MVLTKLNNTLENLRYITQKENSFNADRVYNHIPQDTKDRKILVQKEYQKTHEEKIKQTKKVYTEANKEKIKQCRKEFRELNKDKIALKKKEWYEANKEKIIQKQIIY